MVSPANVIRHDSPSWLVRARLLRARFRSCSRGRTDMRCRADPLRVARHGRVERWALLTADAGLVLPYSRQLLCRGRTVDRRGLSSLARPWLEKVRGMRTRASWTPREICMDSIRCSRRCVIVSVSLLMEPS